MLWQGGEVEVFSDAVVLFKSNLPLKLFDTQKKKSFVCAKPRKIKRPVLKRDYVKCVRECPFVVIRC